MIKNSVILVDDENDVRERIVSKINQSDEFEVIADASNGYDALDLIESLKPDVVITDIKMPFIDGIELIKEIRKNYPTIKVGIISGYDEFHYAKEAIDLNVISYLTKPITQEDVFEFLNRIKVSLEKDRIISEDLTNMKKHFDESKEIVINNTFRTLLTTPNIEDIHKLENYGVNTSSEYIIATLELSEKLSGIEFEKKLSTLRRQATSIFDEEHIAYRVSLSGVLVYIIEVRGDTFKRDIDTTFYKVVKSAEVFMGTEVFIGVSNRLSDFMNLLEAFDESEQARSYHRFVDSGNIVYFNELVEKEHVNLTLTDLQIQSLQYAFKFCTNEELLKTLNEVKSNISLGKDKINSLQLVTINLASIIIRHAGLANVDLKSIGYGNLMDQMVAILSVDDLFDFVGNAILKIRETNIQSKINKSEQILNNALYFIKVNFSSVDLSMEVVCEAVGVSVSYLSMLFKRDKKTSFNKYLVNLRMTKAKELLLMTDLKVVDVAGKCGYNEVYYFSYSFKKFTGMSPKEFRKHEKD